MDNVEKVKNFLASRKLPGGSGVHLEGDRVRWGRLSLVDYGDFFAVEDPMADHDFIGNSVDEALEEYYG